MIYEFNHWAKKHILDNNKFDDNGFIIMENDYNYKSTGIIAQIFNDYWNDYYNKYHSVILDKRPNANDEVNKVIDYSLHNLGTSVYICPNDDEIIFCHHTCKGRLCSSCGIKSQKIRTQNILENCINVPHRHITFTIPNDLNLFFFDNINKIVKKEKIPFKRSLLKWSNSILTSFKRIPIKCLKCGHLMDLVFKVS